MSIITSMRREKAVWWRRTGWDRFGKPSYDEPVEIDCRWEDTTQEFLSAKGEETRSRAVVYVDRDMSVGDRLRRGSMDSDEPADPMTIQTAHEILRFDKLPNFRATEYLLTAYL